MSKRRAWTKRKPEGCIQITQRDVAILMALYDYRFLKTSQIKQKFFGSKSKCDRRLRQLFDHKLVERIQLPVSEGKAELIYALHKNGFTLLQQKGLIKHGTFYKNKISFNYLNHALEIIRFRLVVEEAVRQNSNLKILFWRKREELIKKFEGERIYKLIPDSLFALDTPLGKAYFLLEIDLATETVKTTFGKKMEQYKSYLRNKLFVELFGQENFRVLVVTTTQRRLWSLVKYAEKLDTRLMFWFTTLNKVSLESVFFQPIWLTGDGERKWRPLIRRG